MMMIVMMIVMMIMMMIMISIMILITTMIMIEDLHDLLVRQRLSRSLVHVLLL